MSKWDLVSYMIGQAVFFGVFIGVVLYVAGVTCYCLYGVGHFISKQLDKLWPGNKDDTNDWPAED